VYYVNGTWHIGTTQCFNAFNSYIDEFRTFGLLFIQAIQENYGLTFPQFLTKLDPAFSYTYILTIPGFHILANKNYSSFLLSLSSIYNKNNAEFVQYQVYAHDTFNEHNLLLDTKEGCMEFLTRLQNNDLTLPTDKYMLYIKLQGYQVSFKVQIKTEQYTKLSKLLYYNHQQSLYERLIDIRTFSNKVYAEFKTINKECESIVEKVEHDLEQLVNTIYALYRAEYIFKKKQFNKLLNSSDFEKTHIHIMKTILELLDKQYKKTNTYINSSDIWKVLITNITTEDLLLVLAKLNLNITFRHNKKHVNKNYEKEFFTEMDLFLENE
jgi:hypothetical protein